MLLSLGHDSVVKFVVILICWCWLDVLVYCSVEKRETPLIETCSYPDVHFAYFDDDNFIPRQPPVLHFTSSSEDLHVKKQFPFQYIFLTCDAPYPVEWIASVPQHYYYSYILDDEVRPVPKENDKVINEHIEQDGFAVRLHIGNETWANKDIKSVSVVCQPVEKDGCGKTLVSIWRPDQNVSENIEKMTLLFDNVALESKLIADDQLSKDIQPKQNCIDQSVANAFKMNNKTLNCTVTVTGIKDFFKYEDKETTHKCAAGADFSSRLKINQTSLMPPGGVVSCSGNVQDQDYTYNFSYFYTLPKLCSNEDAKLPRLYYTNIYNGVTPTVKETDFLSLCIQNASTSIIFVGENITVTCVSSIYYFAQGMQLQLTMFNGVLNRTNISKYINLGKSTKEYSYGPEGYRNITTTLILESDSNQEIKCAAPVRKSRKWIEKTVLIKPKVPDKISFQNTPDAAIKDSAGNTYIFCNATGDPLPSLSWSRLSNEKLPSNKTIMQYGTTKNNKVGWISSKLYFPRIPDLNLSEYRGRYICTATNKFNAFEKIFLFDEQTRPGEESQGVFFGRTVWFWIMLTFALLMLTGSAVWFGWKLRRQRRKLRLFTKAEINDFLLGRPELLLDDSNVYEEMNTYASYMPYDKHQFEIHREQLEFDPKDILGTGAYGTVYKGRFKGNYGEVVPVAVKTVNPSSDKTYFAALLSEIKIMCYIGQHENVVGLIGACTKYLHQRQIFVATEYCSNGDLLSYIVKHRDKFMKNSRVEKPKEEFVGIQGKTQGMAYLSSKKVIHGDLAARNILLAAGLEIKIADFGLSKQLQKYASYVRKGDDLVPWRWLAVECLQFMKFSIQSDVWAYGVVLYELFSLGQVPYANHTYSELFIVSLCQGERLQQPAYASNKLYNLMLDCWKHSAEHRPSFHSIENELKIMREESENKMLVSISSSGELNVANPKMDATLYCGNNDYQNVAERNSRRERLENTTTHNGYLTDMGSVLTQTEVLVNEKSELHGLSKLPSSSLPLPSSYVDWNVLSD